VMPEMLGFELLERLRDDAATLKIPVVVVTSKVLTPEEEGRLAAQGAALLAKEAFALSDAAARIREALARAGWTAAAEPATQGVRP
jgi:CheY-like chemotaxis protein